VPAQHARSPPSGPSFYFRNWDRNWEDQCGTAMSIARIDDRAAARHSTILARLAFAGPALQAIGATFGRLRPRGERIGSETPLSDHLRRDIGLPPDPSRRAWREG
jgi:hypothetical protein